MLFRSHATFQVQHQVERILSSFESRVVTKLDSLKQKSSSSTNGCSPNGLSATIEGGRWYHWERHYRKVPSDWNFPNKITLHTAMHRYYLPDQMNGIYPLKYMTGTDVIKCKNDRHNISTLHMLMKYMADEAGKKNIPTLSSKPTEYDVNKYYKKVSEFIFSLSNNSISESFIW